MDRRPESCQQSGAGWIRISEKLAKFLESPRAPRLLILNISQCALEESEISRKYRPFYSNFNAESRRPSSLGPRQIGNIITIIIILITIPKSRGLRPFGSLFGRSSDPPADTFGGVRFLNRREV